MPKSLLTSTVLGLVIFAAVTAFAADESGTADEAKALLAKAVTAVKADKAGALAKFDDANGGFKEKDLYVFCFDRTTGIASAGPVKGNDVRPLRDPAGNAFGQEMFDKAKDGEVVSVDYMFPKPGTADPVAKKSFVEGIGDTVCGVGYYK
jgi:hypothetical protein